MLVLDRVSVDNGRDLMTSHTILRIKIREVVDVQVRKGAVNMSTDLLASGRRAKNPYNGHGIAAFRVKERGL